MGGGRDRVWREEEGELASTRRGAEEVHGQLGGGREGRREVGACGGGGDVPGRRGEASCQTDEIEVDRQQSMILEEEVLRELF